MEHPRWTDQRPRASSTCLSADPGPGPSFRGEHMCRLSGVGALLDCVPRVCGGGGGGCAGGGAAGGCARAVLVWGGVSGG